MGQRRSGMVRAGFRRAGDSIPGTVSTWQGTNGLTPTTPTAGAVVASQTLVARWTVGITRVYAIDGANGNDANVGFADPATSSAADYATACALAGTRALKTYAGLAAIFPLLGNGRSVEIVIASGSYTGGLGVFLAGLNGYASGSPTVRGTGTSTTAGCTAFDGSAADCTFVGAITGTGMNAAGYNPTGAPTTSVVQCLKVGGAAPAFAAEPAAPLGLRIRFDAATSTAALRNICRTISKVSGGDTLTWANSALPAVPAAADVFYIEQAGVICSASTTLNDNDTGSAATSVQQTIVGIDGAMTLREGRFLLAFCNIGAVAAQGCKDLVTAQAYTHPVRGALTIGGSRQTGSFSTTLCRNTFNYLAVTTVALGLISSTLITLTSGLVLGLGLTISGSYQNNNGIVLGNSVAFVGVPPRILSGTGSAGLVLSAVNLSIGQVLIENVGARPAISLQGIGSYVSFTPTAAGDVAGTTGNTDVGLSVVSSRGAVILIATTNLPTVTGTAGDIRLAGGQIVTWAQAAKGLVDLQGNHFFGSPDGGTATTASRGPNRKIPFSGTIVGGAGATVSYLADTGPLAANQIVPLRRPVSACLMRALRVTNLANTSANAVTVTLYKNGAATTMLISIPAATAANTKFADTTHPIFFDDADDYDLRMDDAADVGGVVTVSGTLEYC